MPPRADGGLVAYLIDQRDGTSSVYVQSVTADGWPADDLLLASSPGADRAGSVTGRRRVR